MMTYAIGMLLSAAVMWLSLRWLDRVLPRLK
jgi:hypothetical protein